MKLKERNENKMSSHLRTWWKNICCPLCHIALVVLWCLYLIVLTTYSKPRESKDKEKTKLIKGKDRHSAYAYKGLKRSNIITFLSFSSTRAIIFLDYVVEQEQWTILPVLLEALRVEISDVLYGFITAIFGFELRGTFPFWYRVTFHNHNSIGIWNVKVPHMFILG